MLKNIAMILISLSQVYNIYLLLDVYKLFCPNKWSPVPKFTRQPQSPTQQVKTKQPVPKRTEKPVMGQKTQKDFVKTNVLEATTLSTLIIIYLYNSTEPLY